MLDVGVQALLDYDSYASCGRIGYEKIHSVLVPASAVEVELVGVG
jgi:hypothetical protein